MFSKLYRTKKNTIYINKPSRCVFQGPHLRDHLADGRPKGLFHSTPCSCTLVLMSSASESDCSMDDQGENRDERDEDGNMMSGFPHPAGWSQKKTKQKSLQFFK